MCEAENVSSESLQSVILGKTTYNIIIFEKYVAGWGDYNIKCNIYIQKNIIIRRAILAKYPLSVLILPQHNNFKMLSFGFAFLVSYKTT